MSKLLLIIYCACSAWMFAEGTGWMATIKYKLNVDRLKPFDCTMCFAFWLTLAFFSFRFGWQIENILYALTASVAGIYISIRMRN